ncbi:protein farnesyltransferase subunit beta-like isoform X2 [Gordionus sp. m RMFG-2023]|uniref:protein farnesyltransferase subunit beta-like isoform X2 n=1 Tax=Gordionus sp. m RMFG-2023 TaxID=3053472 RepID=UPI0031FD7458
MDNHHQRVLKNIDQYDLKFKEDDTLTRKEQEKIENNILKIFKHFELLNHDEIFEPELLIDSHVSFLRKGLHVLSDSYECLDASQTWLIYWIVHSLILLKFNIPEETKDKIISFLDRCQAEKGGFGGGPGQIPHLAATYAAISALCTLDNFKAYEIIDRQQGLILGRPLQNNGPQICYTKFKISYHMVNIKFCIQRPREIFAFSNELQEDFLNVKIMNCQTYEGGFSCTPGSEAHGGYTFCGFATLLLMDKQHLCDMPSLMRWLVNRQMPIEGGFNGRTNKLVDSCYSFWVGAIFPLIFEAQYLKSCNNTQKSDSPHIPCLDNWIFDSEALQEYILICCQSLTGSLIDKPGKPKDYYHTCYALSGLSVAQHSFNNKPFIIGNPNNDLSYIHPLYNLEINAERKAKSYFSKLPLPQKPNIIPQKN